MPFVIAADFDDTIFKNAWHTKGEPNQEVIDKLKEFKKFGAEIALWTCREGTKLKEAVQKCKDVGLELDSINENTPSTKVTIKEMAKEWGDEPFAESKILANFYLDDRAYNIEFFLQINVEQTCKNY